MRILLVSPYFPPQNAVASLRTHGFARAWADAGHEVTVLTTAKRADQCGLELPCDGMEVMEIGFRVPGLFERMRAAGKSSDDTSLESAPQKPSLAQRLKQRTGIFSTVRMPDLTDWWVKPAIAWARDRTRACGPWDAAVSSSGPYTAHRVARSLREEGLARKWIADFRDLWTGNHLHPGLWPFTWIERRIERKCLHEAEGVVTVSDGLASRLRSVAGEPVEVVLNGFDPEAMRLLSPEPAFPDDGLCRIVYTGTFYPQGQDAGPVLQALRRLREQHPSVRLITAGQGSKTWQDLARTHDVQGMVEVHDVLPRERAMRFQRDADALLLLDWRDSTQGVLTGKVFEYIAARAPILITGGDPRSPLAQLVQRAGRGVYAGNDPTAIARCLAMPDEMPVHRDEAFIASLTRQHQSMRLLEFLMRG